MSLLTEQQVTDAAAVELGGPLAAQDVDAIRGRVAALAPVAEVRVERHFPHTIEIQRLFLFLIQLLSPDRWKPCQEDVETPII